MSRKEELLKELVENYPNLAAAIGTSLQLQIPMEFVLKCLTEEIRNDILEEMDDGAEHLVETLLEILELEYSVSQRLN